MPSLNRIPLLLAAVLLTATLALQAQSADFQAQHPSLAVPDQPSPAAPWASANPRPGFNQVVRIFYRDNHATSYGFAGRGDAILVGGPRPIVFPFHYNCGRTFEGGTSYLYPARWLKANRKLQILIGDPNSDRTQKCTLSAIHHS